MFTDGMFTNAGLWVKPLTDTVRGNQNIANKGFRIACDQTFPTFKLFVTNKQKNLENIHQNL